MDDTNSLIEQRKAKLAALRSRGIDPFKNKFTPTESCADARKNYTEGREVAVAGRITAHRDMGKSMFIDVRDQSGRLQIYAQKNHLEETAPGSWDIFTHLDLGDFIGVRGKLFTTKTGEISIKLDSFVILAKALRPPPAKWHGLEDTEIRYRQRYLDLMANPEVKDVLLKRSEIIREIRNFLHARGYVEVETPMMQTIPGGAAAQPFKTHHNALGCDFYLRIALELYLKRLLVGGVDKVFEIGRNFRNEGLSRKHNPEFTMLEAYQAFGDYETMMKLVEEMICHVAQKILGKTKIYRPRTEYFKHQLNFIHDVASANLPADQTGEFLAAIKECLELQSSQETELIAAKANEAAQKLAAKFQAGGDHSKIATDILKWIAPYLERQEINLERPWKRAKYKDLIRTIYKNWFEISPGERFCRMVALGEEPELLVGHDLHKLAVLIQKGEASREIRVRQQLENLSKQMSTEGMPSDVDVTSTIFEKFIEPKLIQPTFVTHLPKELVPLAKLSPDDPTTVEVFECCINGQEISPGYTEQNDPIEQRERLEHQAGGEQQKLDEDFLVALEHGMPPAGGIGIGIDRLCMMLLGQESIRDVILFPQLKPK
ncbi:MAG TPA: lysine--tRNA ligase [Candidatus Sulfopaludibacter sp.]|nr:lysine--tRNA ligase [Candidatus Sulfopaludibacter sp.]